MYVPAISALDVQHIFSMNLSKSPPLHLRKKEESWKKFIVYLNQVELQNSFLNQIGQIKLFDIRDFEKTGWTSKIHYFWTCGFFSFLDVYNVPRTFIFFQNLSAPDVLIRYRTFIFFDVMSHLDFYWERTLIRYSRVLLNWGLFCQGPWL